MSYLNSISPCMFNQLVAKPDGQNINFVKQDKIFCFHQRNTTIKKCQLGFLGIFWVDTEDIRVLHWFIFQTNKHIQSYDGSWEFKFSWILVLALWNSQNLTFVHRYLQFGIKSQLNYQDYRQNLLVQWNILNQHISKAKLWMHGQLMKMENPFPR